jgi:hypothetical protein
VAYNISLFFWVACGLMLLLLMFCVVSDEDDVQQRILIALRQKYDHPAVDPDKSYNSDMQSDPVYLSINPILAEDDQVCIQGQQLS